MTLGHFLDAAYASLVEEYRRLGADLQTAFVELGMYRAGGPKEAATASDAETAFVRSEAAQVLENERAFAELQKMMASVR